MCTRITNPESCSDAEISLVNPIGIFFLRDPNANPYKKDITHESSLQCVCGEIFHPIKSKNNIFFIPEHKQPKFAIGEEKEPYISSSTTEEKSQCRFSNHAIIKCKDGYRIISHG